jgi:hypothetical protein
VDNYPVFSGILMVHLISCYDIISLQTKINYNRKRWTMSDYNMFANTLKRSVLLFADSLAKNCPSPNASSFVT